MGRAALFLAVFLCTAGFDQGSKEWARTLPAGVRRPVIDGYWDWEPARNPGAAFSSFVGIAGARVLLTAIAIAALIAIGVAAARARPDQKLKLAALALIGGGTLGNVIDRVRDGAVTDFVRWRIGDHLWPIFNVADAALLAGVALLVIDGIRVRRARSALAADGAAP